MEILQKLVDESASDFEYLENFRLIIRNNLPNLSDVEIKEKALELIEILLKKRLLDIHNIKDDTKWDLSIQETIHKIDKIWFEGASYLDLISTIYFRRQDWFYEKLKSSGYDFVSNWSDFVNRNSWLRKLLSVNQEY